MYRFLVECNELCNFASLKFKFIGNFMKQLIIILMTVLMSLSTSAFAGTKNSTEAKIDLTSITIPTNITVKQTVIFKNGKTIALYYQKLGDVCKLYSTTDVTKYKESDLGKIKSTNFSNISFYFGACHIGTFQS